MPENRSLIPAERMERSILLIRQQKGILSPDLAVLYEVEPRALVQAVRGLGPLEITKCDFKCIRLGRSPMPSRNKAWPCLPACCAARGPWR